MGAELGQWHEWDFRRPARTGTCWTSEANAQAPRTFFRAHQPFLSRATEPRGRSTSTGPGSSGWSVDDQYRTTWWCSSARTSRGAELGVRYQLLSATPTRTIASACRPRRRFRHEVFNTDEPQPLGGSGVGNDKPVYVSGRSRPMARITPFAIRIPPCGCRLSGDGVRFETASPAENLGGCIRRGTKMKKECIAMLLAGGQGSRLYVLTGDMAKPRGAVRRQSSGSSTFRSPTARTRASTRWAC